MNQPILVINAGSSSVKFSLFETLAGGSLRAEIHGQVAGIGTAARFTVSDGAGGKLLDRSCAAPYQEAGVVAILNWLNEHIGGEAKLASVGHRVVHGGANFFAPVRINEDVLAELEALVPLAPLHQPHNIAAIRAVASAAPTVPQVACFDTAFHHDQPPLARTFALPRTLTENGLRRYGFHGLSYEYVVSRMREIEPGCAGGRLIVAHLGNGASLCAIKGGCSIATTMGLTALDGLVMGTRCGALDPGVVLYLLQHKGMDAVAVEHLLYEESGLLGVSGISSDMRTLLASRERAAGEAVNLFVYRIGREMGSLAAAMGGIDALVFTGGIGENAAVIRARVCRDAAWLGVALDATANEAGGPRISPPGAAVSAWVVPTDENLMVARHTHRLLDRAATQ
jgi:acetate kinase